MTLTTSIAPWKSQSLVLTKLMHILSIKFINSNNIKGTPGEKSLGTYTLLHASFKKGYLKRLIQLLNQVAQLNGQGLWAMVIELMQLSSKSRAGCYITDAITCWDRAALLQGGLWDSLDRQSTCELLDGTGERGWWWSTGIGCSD